MKKLEIKTFKKLHRAFIEAYAINSMINNIDDDTIDLISKALEDYKKYIIYYLKS